MTTNETALDAPSATRDCFISVDVETAGPNPGNYAMLSLGACLLLDPEQNFYVELKPDSDRVEADALAVSGLSMAELARTGVEPAVAMGQFADWLARVVPAGQRPVMVGFNAPFDWMFVCEYFGRYLGRNPLGHSAIDIKAYYMGLTGVTWSETSMSFLAEHYLQGAALTHNALGDARDQAELFRRMLADAPAHRRPSARVLTPGESSAMTPPNAPDTAASSGYDVNLIVESAVRLGIEIDEEEALQWLAALTADFEDDIVVDAASHTFGHRISMLDFSDRDLARFRRIGEIVEVTGPAEFVESALALSGSAAQSKIQSFPGDCDYFQRLNIKAPTREEACRIMAQLFREKVQRHARGDTYQFLEAKLGSYPANGLHRGAPCSAGSPISWSLDEITAGQLSIQAQDGATTTVRWEDAALDPGWCKLDWVVADPDRRQLSNASNVIDVTWEAPDGQIVALDGYLDAYFQEVYLDADAVPVFAKVARFVSDDALDDYVDRLEQEVRKYLTNQLNYGKAAKRMYNIFRLSGRHLDAAFVRELFDEPATILYQVWSLIVTLNNATQPGSSIPLDAVRDQADELLLRVVEVLDGEEESEIVAALLRLRRSLETQQTGAERTAEVQSAQTRVINLVNTFFQDKLTAMPTIREYIENIQAEYTP